MRGVLGWNSGRGSWDETGVQGRNFGRGSAGERSPTKKLRRLLEMRSKFLVIFDIYIQYEK